MAKKAQKVEKPKILKRLKPKKKPTLFSFFFGLIAFDRINLTITTLLFRAPLVAISAQKENRGKKGHNFDNEY